MFTVENTEDQRLIDLNQRFKVVQTEKDGTRTIIAFMSSRFRAHAVTNLLNADHPFKVKP